MQNLKTSWIGLSVYSFCLALISIFVLMGVLASPSEPKNAIVLGLSLPRLLLVTGLFVAFISSLIIGIRSFRDRAWAESTLERWFGGNVHGQAVSWLASIGFGLGWIGCFLPSYRAGLLAMHWERLRPAMLFILLASLVTLAISFIKQSNLKIEGGKRSLYKLSLILFIPSILVVGVMLSTGFGVYALEDYWYGAGVPILTSQLVTTILGGIIFLQIEKREVSKRFDILILVLIYAGTAILWALEPLQKSFLFIGPYAPNRVLYPFADAALFDTASQFALIGQNFLFYNGQFFERALYASFLVFLHSLFGQDYGHVMAAQAAVFAVFPALVYLIGKSLHTRAVGFAAAVVAAFRGMNSIAASNMIDMANPKMMLTDFPTAIAVALIILLTCQWLKGPRQKWHYPLWIGGIVGLAIMLRTNALVFLLLIPLYAILMFSRDWKKWIASSVLFIIAVVVTTLPWELRNQSLGGKMYSSFLTKFQSVIDLRYKSPLPPESFFPQENVLSVLSLKQTQALLEVYSDIDVNQEPSCNSIACFVPNHFLHNILTSVLILPTSPVLDDLRHTVKESYPYWRPDWNGSFTNPSLFFFVLNIFFIVLGISVAWRQHRFIGLLPVVVFVVYNLSNAFARTSGGRYIVPIDWILTLYFLIGVFQIIILLANSLGVRWTLFRESAQPGAQTENPLRNDWLRVLAILVILFGLGSLVPLAEVLYPNRYQGFDLSKLISQHERQLAETGLSLQEIKLFLQNPNAQVTIGRALYPRYYVENQGEVHFYPVVVMGFPRTTFTLIGPAGEQGIVLPGEKPEHFPHAVDTLVLGCREQLYVDALAVIVLDEKGAVYTRSPESPLACPLKQPVCDNNHNCY